MLREFEVVSMLSLVLSEISQSTVVSEEGFSVPVIRVLEPRALALVGVVPPVAIDVVVDDFDGDIAVDVDVDNEFF